MMMKKPIESEIYKHLLYVGVVNRAYAPHSSTSLSSHTRLLTFNIGNNCFLAWHSIFKKWCGDQVGKFTCCVFGKTLIGMTTW